MKTPSAVLAYAQKAGSTRLQAFLSKSQRRLQEYLDDAKEWREAEAVASAERLSDWELVSSKARQSCKCKDGLCQWWQAAEEFFERNAATIDRKALAASLAAVIRF